MNRRVNIQKSGNWSDPDLWYGGLLPLPTDIVYSNGFDVYIDQNINVKRITNEPTYPDVPPGKFIVNSDVAIQADLKCGSLPLLDCLSGHLNIVGNVYGSDIAGEIACIQNINTGTVEVSGIVVGGSTGYAYGILNKEFGTINVTGTIGRGWGAFSVAIYNVQNGKVIINGVESTDSGYYGTDIIERGYGDQPQF